MFGSGQAQGDAPADQHRTATPITATRSGRHPGAGGIARARERRGRAVRAAPRAWWESRLARRDLLLEHAAVSAGHELGGEPVAAPLLVDHDAPPRGRLDDRRIWRSCSQHIPELDAVAAQSERQRKAATHGRNGPSAARSSCSRRARRGTTLSAHARPTPAAVAPRLASVASRSRCSTIAVPSRNGCAIATGGLAHSTRSRTSRPRTQAMPV
jgi:hypothetical protein